MEGISLFERRSGSARWSSDIGFDYHLMGTQSSTNAVPLSRLPFLRMGWVAPTLSAVPLQVITRSGNATHAATRDPALAPDLIEHPLREEREHSSRDEGCVAARRRAAGRWPARRLRWATA